MHIIKITSVSFKIILTKEDVDKYCKKYVLNDKIDSYGFYAEIKDKTDALFDYPFDELSVDAEFFESKDGGGELFLTAIPKIKLHNYIFLTKDSDVLSSLCLRLVKFKMPVESKLYFNNDCYNLLVKFEEMPDEVIVGVMNEYGECNIVEDIYDWYLQEHAKCIFENDALVKIVQKFIR